MKGGGGEREKDRGERERERERYEAGAMCGSVDGWSRRKAEEYETIASLESQESLEPVGV